MIRLSLKGISLPTFLYELRRTLLSPAVIVVMILTAVISFAVIASFSADIGTPQITDQYAGYAYYLPGQEHIVIYASDSYGRPVAGVTVLARLCLQGPQNSLSPPLENLTGTSGADGFISLTGHLWDNNTGGYAVNTTLTDPRMPNLDQNGNDSVDFTFFINLNPIGVIEQIQGSGGGFGMSPISTVLSGTNPNVPDALQVVWAGPNGTVPWGDQLRYFLTYSNNPSARAANQTILIGNLTADVQSLPLTIHGYSTSSRTPVMIVELFSPTGSLLVATQANAQAFYPGTVAMSAPSYVFAFVGEIMALFVPLMAVVAAYSSYGKDRTSGTIEAVLAQPISREGLVLSRYIAVIAALATALAVAAGIIDVLTNHYAGTYLPANDVLGFYAALVIVAATYAGFVFLFSHLLRTTGGVIGAAVGVYMLFGLVWTTVVTELVAIILGYSGGGHAYTALALDLQFLSPTGVVTLTQVLGVGGFAVFSSETFNPASYGVTFVTVGLAGLAWAMIPLALTLYLVKIRD